jgi:hypothetical protein
MEAMLRDNEVAAATELKRRGWGDAEINALLKRRQVAQKHGLKDFKAPDVKKVLDIVSRRAPAATTLRRRASSRKLRREKIITH